MHTPPSNSHLHHERKKLKVVVYLTKQSRPEILPILVRRSDLDLRIIRDEEEQDYLRVVSGTTGTMATKSIQNRPEHQSLEASIVTGHRLARWADICLVTATANLTASMLVGLTCCTVSHMLRSWDTSKKVIMIPELSIDQLSHPIWRKQQSKIKKRLIWVQLLQPIVWTIPDNADDVLSTVTEMPTASLSWDGSAELVEAIDSEVVRVERFMSGSDGTVVATTPEKSKSALPAELWTQIMDMVRDWELATALGIYTQTPVPPEWTSLVPVSGTRYPTLEWTILTQPLSRIKSFFEWQAKQQLPQKALSQVALSVILRFCRRDVLTYLSTSQKDIFWSSFPTDALPRQASLIYNSPALLQWWSTSPAVIKKECDAKIIDGASRAGFIDVLQWWLDSGIPLCYTDKALEGASARGMIDVLEWWRLNHQKAAANHQDLPLKVGKSIWLAAQAGQTEAVAWWERSGIAYTHEEKVATVASQFGHVDVLDLWYGIKGSKMIFDNQVLVGPSRQGHPRVLEWWKQASLNYGLRVEYKTCDIEEAMEDAVGGGIHGEAEVRAWWQRNGLNLGVGTGEWMKVKTL